MYILAIETTGPHCSAAIIDGAGNVTEKKLGRNKESFAKAPAYGARLAYRL